jgi:hypothetical protein
VNITRTQWIAIAMLALGLIAGGTSQLTELFGVGVAKNLSSAASFLSSFVAGLQIILGGQGQQIKDVAAMPGIEKVLVNASANQTAATLAVDPKQDKVAPTTAAMTAVENTAKGG